MTVEVGAVRWIAAVPLPEPIWVRTESQEPAMTHFGREPVMATSSSEPSMAAVIRRREYVSCPWVVATHQRLWCHSLAFPRTPSGVRPLVQRPVWERSVLS
jgi:hypothetical protein